MQCELYANIFQCMLEPDLENKRIEVDRNDSSKCGHLETKIRFLNCIVCRNNLAFLIHLVIQRYLLSKEFFVLMNFLDYNRLEKLLFGQSHPNLSLFH